MKSDNPTVQHVCTSESILLTICIQYDSLLMSELLSSTLKGIIIPKTLLCVLLHDEIIIKWCCLYTKWESWYNL